MLTSSSHINHCSCSLFLTNISYIDIEIQWGYGWTEPHYDTFDGAGIDFQGVGTYVMSQYANNNPDICHGLRDFQVLAEQEIRNGDDSVSYIGSVTLVLPDIVTVTIGQNRQLTVVSETHFVLLCLNYIYTHICIHITYTYTYIHV